MTALFQEMKMPTSQKNKAKAVKEPTVSRPKMPREYGLPKDKKGLLPWSHVDERMRAAKHYWVGTVSPDGHPHATPVDGLWVDGQLYFGGSVETRRHRNMLANPAVCIHLEDALDVVILRGEVQELHAPEASLATRLAEASTQKYGYAPKPEDFGKGGVWVFRPRVVLAWKQSLKDATRWQFE
jgi:nitroimidazol reductase NimA-like FMN-containing flavoprotein (pyridoxamine 5'-phosphate oxidase superfamily)